MMTSDEGFPLLPVYTPGYSNIVIHTLSRSVCHPTNPLFIAGLGAKAPLPKTPVEVCGQIKCQSLANLALQWAVSFESISQTMTYSSGLLVGVAGRIFGKLSNIYSDSQLLVPGRYTV